MTAVVEPSTERATASPADPAPLPAAGTVAGARVLRRVRRPRGLLLAVEDGLLVALPPHRSAAVPLPPSALAALRAGDDWTDEDALGLDPGGVDYLLRVGLLVEQGTGPGDLDDGLGAWDRLGAETVAFHFRSRWEYVDHRLPANETEALAALDGDAPPITKRYPTVPLALPPVDASRLTRPFGEVLAARRTVRTYDEAPLALDDLATLLGAVFGATGVVDAPAPWGPTMERTSPSGGSRHPTEAYVCVRRVEGVDPGVYHYAPLVHALEAVPGAATPATCAATLAQPELGEAAVVVFLTSVVGRSRWKYPFARLYRTLLLDAGHLAQTFVLTATALGLAPFQTAAFRDPDLEAALGLDPAEEIALHVVGAAHHPVGVPASTDEEVGA